ncbi:MAG: hypothetical protein LBH01_03830 [Verrucomicrobiales bacterium]|jgi:hypothetical protein|nr:hypothetical protein [Verrucomicrobiales bacterium]
MNLLTKILLFFLAPGEKLPPGTVQPPSLEAEGLSWGWALLLIIALITGVVWAYRKFAPRLAWPWRVLLIALRSILLAILVLMLTKPVLHIMVDESVRHPLIVLLDQTQSMGLVDQRDALNDLTRAALAKGDVPPDRGLKQPPSDAQIGALKQLSRKQLLGLLAANDKMNLWSRLYDHVNLEVYGFGRKAAKLGELAPANGGKLTVQDAMQFFKQVRYEENVTALGDSLRQVLDEQRGQSPAGILVISDGASNTGAPALEAAGIAKQDGVPLFLYGIGVASPQDIIVSAVNGPPTSNVKERVSFVARVKTQGMLGKKTRIQLKADGKVVDEQPLEIRSDGEQEITLGYKPEVTGDVNIEVTVPPLPEEALKDNNTATTKVRIVDDKINILLVQQEPNWDFEYLLTLMQRDRRLQVKCVVIKGDKDIDTSPDSPYLNEIPTDKKELFKNDVIILNDVDPAVLGAAWMDLLKEWVDKVGGGLLLVGGTKFLPNAYVGTALEPLLPVELQASKAVQRYDSPVTLMLTVAGESSPFLTLSDNPEENRNLWKKFPGVNWTAWVGNVRPGAQTLLADPTSERATRSGPMPVIAVQNFGLGQVLYVGTDQTYRWRSKAGDKYFARLWGQFFQVLSNQKMLGNTLTQLKTDKLRYITGERVRISGRLFKSGFEPLTDADVPGMVNIKTPDGKTQTAELRLQSIPDRPGEYHAELLTLMAGSYSFSTVRDPATVLKFDVEDPKVELSDIAMNEKLLKDMATASGGHFLREEDLNKLPDLVLEKSVSNTTFKTIPLNFTPWLLAVLIVSAALEWFLRRKLELK